MNEALHGAKCIVRGFFIVFVGLSDILSNDRRNIRLKGNTYE